MTGKATWAACEWIQAQHPLRPRYILSGSMDTDKKHSAINTLRTRGKRVIAECTIRNEVIQRLMRVDTQTLFRARQISTAGSIMAGSAYNGPHAANGITAIFIATGQDDGERGRIARRHHLRAAARRRLLLVGHLAVTDRRELRRRHRPADAARMPRDDRLLRRNKSDQLAEIVGAVVLAGDVSLGSAVLAGDWVSSHDRLGRNRP